MEIKKEGDAGCLDLIIDENSSEEDKDNVIKLLGVFFEKEKSKLAKAKLLHFMVIVKCGDEAIIDESAIPDELSKYAKEVFPDDCPQSPLELISAINEMEQHYNRLN